MGLIMGSSIIFLMICAFSADIKWMSRIRHVQNTICKNLNATSPQCYHNYNHAKGIKG